MLLFIKMVSVSVGEHMNIKKQTLGLFTTAFLTPVLAQAAILPGTGYVTYGDANSYSLPILQEFVAVENPGPGNPYYVESTPGAIKDLIVVATGSNGAGVTTNADGMDKAYDAPNSSGTNFYTTTDAGNDPGISGGSINNNYDTSWDASLASMSTFLSGNDMVVYFNNNQEKSSGTAAESLAAWAQLWVTDNDNKLVGSVFEFTNLDSAYSLFAPLPSPPSGSGGVGDGDVTVYTSSAGTAGLEYDHTLNNPNATSNVETDYVLSGGSVLGIDHNLGANEAAYALMFPELNTLFDSLFMNVALDLSLYTFHIDFRLGCDPGFSTDPDIEICSGALSGHGKNLNNGFEQIFIGTQEALGRVVPEPGTLLLLGLGLAGLTYRQRKAS